MTFSNGRDLLSHKSSVHNNEAPVFECKTCSKKIKSKLRLDDHMITHTGGDKSFACTLCDMKFSRHRVLQTHIKSHKNREERAEKRKTAVPNVCHICEKKYFHIRFLWNLEKI